MKKKKKEDFYLHDYANRANIVNVYVKMNYRSKILSAKKLSASFRTRFRVTVVRNLLIP